MKRTKILLSPLTIATLATWLGVAAVGCKSDVKLNSSNVQQKPVDAAEVDPGAEVDPNDGAAGRDAADDRDIVSPDAQFHAVEGLEPSAKYYQTRSMIRLYSNLRLADDTDYRLVNTTTGAILREHLSSNEVQDTFNTAQFALAGASVFETLIPSERIPTGALRYGKNELRLLVTQDGQEYAYAATEINIVDFPVFSFAASGFATNVQSSGGFQGWVSALAPPADGASPNLAVGFFDIVNR